MGWNGAVVSMQKRLKNNKETQQASSPRSSTSLSSKDEEIKKLKRKRSVNKWRHLAKRRAVRGSPKA